MYNNKCWSCKRLALKRKVTDTPGRFAMAWRAGELSWRSRY